MRFFGSIALCLTGFGILLQGVAEAGELSCPPGRAPNQAGNSCEDCAPGNYSADGLVCIDCPDGTFSGNAGSIQCVACDVGKAPNATRTACVSCEPGTYSPDGVACLDCPEGTFTNVFGSAACQSCPPRHHPQPGPHRVRSLRSRHLFHRQHHLSRLSRRNLH